MRSRLTCPHCGEDVEQLPFCGNCGRPLTDEPAPGDPAAAAAHPAATENGATGILGRRARRLRLHRPGVTAIRLLVIALAAAVALVALLADEAGLALVVAAVATPILLVESLARRDVFDRLPSIALLVVAAVGIAAGAIAGAIAVWVTDELWLDERRLDVASLGLGARVAEGDGSPPLLVLALAGLLLPAAGAGLAMVGPLYLRRWPAYRNEVMDGVVLGAAAGGGFATGTAIANLWPLLQGDSLTGDVPNWTVATIGVVMLRPLILVATCALIGGAIWRYDLTGRGGDLLLPLFAGLGWVVAYAFVSLFAGDWHPTIGLIWSLGVLVAVAATTRTIVNQAISHDRRWLDAGHVICPRCRSLTPAGRFCSVCRAPLDAAEQEPAEPAPAAASGTTAPSSSPAASMPPE